MGFREGEAAALTPLLFLGHTLSLRHTVSDDVDEACELIRNGTTVLMSNETKALAVMVSLGTDFDRAQFLIRKALGVEPSVAVPTA